MLDRWLLLDWKRFFLIVVAWASAVILHNLIYALFVDYFGPEGDEAIFFILAVIVIPAYFVLALAYTAIRKYGEWRKQSNTTDLGRGESL
ncbi:hypothetical protein KFU94_25450 [Chloroflexi bacterium TSY]|nr:hypothetical protein [Chloroflexi bacterium TSY]